MVECWLSKILMVNIKGFVTSALRSPLPIRNFFPVHGGTKISSEYLDNYQQNNLGVSS